MELRFVTHTHTHSRREASYKPHGVGRLGVWREIARALVAIARVAAVEKLKNEGEREQFRRV
jgi:hypothetical protein